MSFKSYNQKTSFASGLTRVFSYIVSTILPKYETHHKLQTKILSIKNFYEYLINDENIKKVSDNAVNILEIIKNDVISHVNVLLNKTGGDEINAGVIINPVESKLNSKISDRIALLSDLSSDLSNDMSNNFKSYFDERVNMFESIKILTDFKPEQPTLAKYLIDDLLAQYTLGLRSDKKIKLITYSIIDWYLSHNNARGIASDAYDTMMMKVQSEDGIYDYFISDIYSYLVPGSENWHKAQGG